jgi:hypothetical protein
VGMVLPDYREAFDIINHRVLLKKLTYYGFGRNDTKWFASYLSSRTGYVNSNLTASLTTPDVGVRQGSALCPLIFNIYVSDLCDASARCTLVQYADDTTILVKSRKSAVGFSTKFEFATNEIVQWFRENRLHVNVKKTKFTVFGRSEYFVSDVTINSHKVLVCDCVTLLGLRIECNLSYVSDVNYAIARTRHTRVMLSRLAHLFNFHTR